MAEKWLKIVQDGRPSFVPDNSQNRKFWSRQNAKMAGSQNAQKEMATIIPASAEENEELNAMAAMSATRNAISAIPATVELDELKRQLAQQQELINKLLLENKGEPVVNTGEPEKEKGKPGPKPKNNTNGEGQ